MLLLTLSMGAAGIKFDLRGVHLMKCYCKESPNGFYHVVEDAPENTHDLIQSESM